MSRVAGNDNAATHDDPRAEIEELISRYSEEHTPDEICADPEVSVVCRAFNHGEFLESCLESMLMQETDFAFEILIGDDCSTDETLEIARRYQARYPSVIRIFTARTNLFGFVGSPLVNTWRLLRECRGRYIAFLEGDDHWTDKDKLAKQHRYLETCSEASGCFTDCVIVDARGKEIQPRPFWNDPYRERYTQRECLTDLRSAYATGSLMFRGKVLQEGVPRYFFEAGTDFLLDLVVTADGALHHLPLSTVAYRIHEGGWWQGRSRVFNDLQMLVRLGALEADESFAAEYDEEIAALRRRAYEKILFLKRDSPLTKRFQHIREDEYPVSIFTGTFDLSRPDAEALETWLATVADLSWWKFEIVLAVRDRESADLVWRRRDGSLLVRRLPAESFAWGKHSTRLPDFPAEDELAPVSGKRIQQGLSPAALDWERESRKIVVGNLENLNRARKRRKKVEGSRYWRWGRPVRKIFGNGIGF